MWPRLIRWVSVLIIFVMGSFFGERPSFAQAVIFTPRENTIFTTLNELQGREDALLDSMQEAQMRLAEEGMSAAEEQESIKKRGRGIGFSLRDLQSRMHPYLTFSTTSTDNFDNNADQRKSTVTYTATPGMQMNFAGRGKSLSIDMHANDYYYNNRSRNTYQDATGSALFGLGVGRYTFSLADDYYTNYVASSFLGTKRDVLSFFQSNAITANIGSHFNRIGFDISGKRADYSHEPDGKSTGDHYEETFTIAQYLRIATKTRFLLSGTYGFTEYTRRPQPCQDTNFKTFNSAITGVLSPKVTYSLNADCILNYNKTGDDARNRTYGTNIAYQLNQRTDLSLLFSHSIHDVNTKTAYSRNDTITLSGNYRPAFNTKFKLSPSYSIGLLRYPKQVEDTILNNTYLLGLGLSYVFRRWLDFSLDYSNSKVVSNGGGEHETNTVTFKTLARF